jgi:hypothetical protein
MDSPRASVDFRHPWLVSLGGGGARIGKGYILAEIGIEPVIGSVPISGADGQPAPVLKLDPDLGNELGESWICVEVTPTAEGKLVVEGKLAEGARVECVHRLTPLVTNGPTGRTPLALLVRRGNAWAVWQIAFFHFRYMGSQTSEGQLRHFFL